MIVQAYCAKIDEAKVCVGKVDKANEKCCAAFAQLQAAEKKCQPLKKAVDTAKDNLDCERFNTCLDQTQKSYQKVEKDVKEAEEQRAWQSLYQIKCLLDSFDGKKLSDK